MELSSTPDQEWTFVSGTPSYITHQRSDNSRFRWEYDKGINTGTDSDTTGTLGNRERGSQVVSNKNGFTLIELIMVMVIIGIRIVSRSKICLTCCKTIWSPSEQGVLLIW